MKKLLISLCMILFVASTGWAYTVGPWMNAGSDTLLGFDQFSPSNEPQELDFANTVLADLGMGSTELLYGSGMKVNFNSGPKDIVYDPEFEWEYAVVKVDGPNDFFYLFQDTALIAGGDDILQTFPAGVYPYNLGTPALGISHITWFGPGEGPPAAVPEPATILLLGAGLVGLGVYSRKRGKK